MNQLSFDEIKQFHERVKASGSPNGQLSLSDFSAKMQQFDPETDYSAGNLPDNIVGNISRGIDTGIGATGLPELASNVTGFIGSGADALAGRQDGHYEQIARGVGQGLPRMAADVGLMLGGTAMNAAAVAAAPVSGGASLAALAPGSALIGAGIADAGIKGYADSGSVKQGVTSAALMGLAPGIGKLGTTAGLAALGKVAPKAIYSGGARVAAAQLGEQGAFLGAMSAEQALNGHNPFTVDNLFANAVGMVGFAPLMVKGGMDVYKATPKRPGVPSWKPELGADQSVRGGGVNDMPRLLNYILQGDDAPLPTMLHEAGGLRQALELTGLDPVGLNSREMGSMLAQRRRAKELIRGADVGEQPAGALSRVEFFKTEAEAQAALAGFPEGSVVEKTGGGPVPRVGPKGGKLTGKNKGFDEGASQWRVKAPEDPAVLSAEWDQLSQEAATLLQTDSGNLVDLLKMMQMANKFAKKFADQQGNVVKPGTPEWRQRLVDEGIVTEGEAGLVPMKDGKYSETPGESGKYSKPAPDTGKFGVEPEETGRFGQPKESGKYGGKPAKKVAKTKASGKKKAGYVEAEQFELPGTETPPAGDAPETRNLGQLIEAKDTAALTKWRNDELERGKAGDEAAEKYRKSLAEREAQAAQIQPKLKAAQQEKARLEGEMKKAAEESDFDTAQRLKREVQNKDFEISELEGDLKRQDVEYYRERAEETARWAEGNRKMAGYLDMEIAKLGESQPKTDQLEVNDPVVIGDGDEVQTGKFVQTKGLKAVVEIGNKRIEVPLGTVKHAPGSPKAEMVRNGDQLFSREKDPLVSVERFQKTEPTLKSNNEQATAFSSRKSIFDYAPNEAVKNVMLRLSQMFDHVLGQNEYMFRGTTHGELKELLSGRKVKTLGKADQTGEGNIFFSSSFGKAGSYALRGFKGEKVPDGVVLFFDKNFLNGKEHNPSPYPQEAYNSRMLKEYDQNGLLGYYDVKTNKIVDLRKAEQFSKNAAEPTGANPKGVYTAETLRAETERLNTIEATPEMAVGRLKQKIVNKLTRFIGGTVVDQNHPAMRLMSETFDNLGLAPGLKGSYMKAAQRIVDFIEVGPARYGRTEKFTTDPTARGVYFGQDHLITIKSTPGQSRDAETASYNALRVLAHESSHALHDLLNTGADAGIDSFRLKHLQDATAYADQLSPQERAEILYKKFEELIPGVGRESFQGVVDYSVQTAREFLTEYGALHAMGKTEPNVVRNALRFVPEPLQNFVKTLLRGMHEITKAVRGVKGEQTPFEKFHKDTEMLYAKDPVIEGLKDAMVKSLQGPAALEAGDIAGNGMQFSKMDIKAIDARVQEHLKVRQSNGFVRNMMQHAQISAGSFYREHFPAYRQLVSSLTTMDGMAVALNHTMRKAFMIAVDGGIYKELSSLPDSKLTQQQIQLKSTLGRIEASPKLQRVAFDTMLKTNELVKQAGETGEAYPTFDSPEVQALLDGLSAGEKADIRQTYEAYLEANKVAADLQVSSELKRFHYVAADYLLGGGMPHDQALSAGRQLMDSILSGDPRNMAQWATVQGADAFVKHWENVKPRFEDFRAKLDRPYFTEFRSGNYGVRYEVLDANNKVIDTGYRSTNDPLQWKAIQRDVASDPTNRIIELMDHRKDPKGRFGQMQTRGLEEATNLVRAHYDAAMANMKPEMAAMFDDVGFDPAQPLVDKVNSDLKTLALRRLAPGREKINMIAAQDAYSSLIARKLANTAARLESNWLMKHESWNQDKLLKQEMQLFRDNVLSAGRQEHQGFRKATTMVMMGGNVSSALVDSLQPISMGLWRATQEVGVMDALKYTAEGFREAFKPIGKISDAGFKSILVEAINRGLLKTGGSLDNFMSSEDTINYNVVKAKSNRDLVDMKGALTSSEFLAGRVMEQFSKLGQKGMEIGMTPMRLSAQINNKNSLWVGYRMGQKKGLKGQELFDYAVQTMQTINLQGQRAAHSSFKMKAGQMNGLVEAAMLMTNYPIAVFGEMVSSWQGMLKSSGLDAATRQRSMQAFAGQVLTQMAFAGVAGVGLKGLFEVAHQMFGLDVEDEVRKATLAIDESGTLGEILLNGVMNTVTGADLSSRFDLSGVGGLNPYTGFDAKGLFGAGGGMIKALYNAPSQFAAGDMSKIQLIPTGFRRMMTAWGDDAYKDSSGQQIINPTTSERFVQMIGFKPTRMARVLEQKSTMRNISTAVSEQASQRKAQIMGLMQQGKMPEVMQMIQQDVLEEMQGPEYADYSPLQMRRAIESKTRENMMELVNYGVEKLLPFDPMASGAGMTAQAMNEANSGFGQNAAPRQSEATRTVLKQQMMQQLGLKLPRGAPRAVRTAQMVDELIRQNPQLTRSQAISMLRSQ